MSSAPALRVASCGPVFYLLPASHCSMIVLLVFSIKWAPFTLFDSFSCFYPFKLFFSSPAFDFASLAPPSLLGCILSASVAPLSFCCILSYSLDYSTRNHIWPTHIYTPTFIFPSSCCCSMTITQASYLPLSHVHRVYLSFFTLVFTVVSTEPVPWYSYQ